LQVVIAGLVTATWKAFSRIPSIAGNTHCRNQHRIAASSIAYAAQFKLDPALYHADLEEMLRSTKPQAFSLFQHLRSPRNRGALRKHRHPGHDGKAPRVISKTATQSNARHAREKSVLVNYETFGIRATTPYELVRSGAIGDVRKVVVHDGIKAQRKLASAPCF